MDAETLELLGFSVTVWVVNIVGFLLLLAMLSPWLWRPIRATIEARAQRVEEQLRGASERLAEAERLREEVRERAAAQQSELARQRQALLAEAQAEADELRQKAREEANEIRRQGRRAAAEMQAQALGGAKAEMAGLAGAMAGRLLSGVLDEDRHRAVLEAALGDLERLVAQEEGD